MLIEELNSHFAKPVLAPVNFDAIHEARRNFIYSNNRYPNVIVMHPADGEKFIELMHKEFCYCAMSNLMKFQGMQMIRSYDVEEGKWCLY
jgi:hypothetical protein